LTSNIINMVDRMKDNEDRKLEALFRSEAIPDEGFSERVVRRIRRRVWIRRWTLPVAMAIGGLIAVKPAVQMLSLLPVLFTLVPDDLKRVPLDVLPQLPMLVTGLAFAGGVALFLRMLED
jgi:hypothetical protein